MPEATAMAAANLGANTHRVGKEHHDNHHELESNSLSLQSSLSMYLGK